MPILYVKNSWLVAVHGLHPNKIPPMESIDFCLFVCIVNCIPRKKVGGGAAQIVSLPRGGEILNLLSTASEWSAGPSQIGIGQTAYGL